MKGDQGTQGIPGTVVGEAVLGVVHADHFSQLPLHSCYTELSLIPRSIFH